jgi:hypothetical protein
MDVRRTVSRGESFCTHSLSQAAVMSCWRTHRTLESLASAITAATWAAARSTKTAFLYERGMEGRWKKFICQSARIQSPLVSDAIQSAALLASRWSGETAAPLPLPRTSPATALPSGWEAAYPDNGATRSAAAPPSPGVPSVPGHPQSRSWWPDNICERRKSCRKF